MNSIWTWLLGEQASEKGDAQLHWANLPESWGVFVLIGIVLLIAGFVFWLYTREINTCPKGVKLLLAGFRFSVLLMLVLMLLRPSVVFKESHTIKPNIAFLRDASMSFAQRDSYDDDSRATRVARATGLDKQQVQTGQLTRAEVLQRVFTLNDNRVLRGLREKGSLQIIDFAEAVETAAVLPPLSGANAPSEPAADTTNAAQKADDLPLLIASGRSTDLWRPLQEQLSDASRLSAVILASDGQHNGQEDPMEWARTARDLGIPIFTIGVGDPSRPKNLSVTDLYVRSKARPNEPFEIEALLYAEDIQASQVLVELIEHFVDASTGELQGASTIDTIDLAVPPLGGRIRADFQHTVASPGTYAYTVRVRPVLGENDEADNQATSSSVQVVDEKVKVLLISGEPTWEYQLLQRLLQRDGAISLSCWLQTMDQERPQEGNEPISQLPTTLEELGQYNVVMMMDPDPEEFDATWIETLQQFCRQKAGGLFYMAGPKFTNMFVTLNRLNGIRDLLPVRFGDADFLETSQALAQTSSSQPGQMLVVNHNLDHPVMSFHNDAQQNQQRWAQMPSIYWSFPALAAKPATRALMERGDQINVEGNQPLLVSGRYGAGNVLYMGFTGTWRWRQVGVRAQYFDRFWIQVVQFLVETRSLQGSRRGIIDAERAEYEIGDRIVLTARALNERFEPMIEPNIAAIVQSEDGRTQSVDLKLLPGQAGQYEASFLAQSTGTFQVLVNLPGTDSASGIEPVTFRVKPPSIESRAYWLNEKLLREIAEVSGGMYFAIDEVDRIAAEVPQMDSTSEYTSPPQPLWDINERLRYLAFLLPFVLLTVEWAVRKRYKLL